MKHTSNFSVQIFVSSAAYIIHSQRQEDALEEKALYHLQWPILWPLEPPAYKTVNFTPTDSKLMEANSVYPTGVSQRTDMADLQQDA